MAESAAFARRGFAGGAARTTLASDISDSAVTISCVSLSTWTGATTNGPITVTISRGQSDEEVIEATGISSNDLTGVTRHVDVGGTTPVAHDAGASVELTSRDRDFDEANRLVNLVLGVGSVVAGDLYYVSAASGGVPTALARLAKGTALQTLRMNSGATAPEWAAPAPPANSTDAVAAQENTASDTYTALGTAGPAATVTTGTKALVIITSDLYNNTAGAGAAMGFAVSGASTIAAGTSAHEISHYDDAASQVARVSGSFLVTGLTAGSNTFTAQYKRPTASGTAQFQNRQITVIDMGS